jgi:hypothetical protein
MNKQEAKMFDALYRRNRAERARVEALEDAAKIADTTESHMSNVSDMASRRAPVIYTVHVIHHWDGEVEVQVEGISPDPRSRKAASEVLLTAAELLESKGVVA